MMHNRTRAQKAMTRMRSRMQPARKTEETAMARKPELLCPAGDMEKLQMAVLYGADAVYLAGTSFRYALVHRKFYA